MTIMNWSLLPDIATLVCDEIGSRPETPGDYDTSHGKGWKPDGLMQKVWSYPALGIMMGARNWAEPTRAIVELLQKGVLAPQTVEDLAELCVPILADGARAAPLPFVAHLFGWSFTRDRAVGYQFVSEEGCEAELLPDGYSLNPVRPAGDMQEMKGWLDVARGQQLVDQALEFGERNHLGGRTIAHELRRPNPGEGPAIIARCLGTLSGAEELVASANARMSAMFDTHGVALPQAAQ